MFAQVTELLAEPAMQLGFYGLCAAMLAALIWIIKRLFEMLKNSMQHIDQKVDRLVNLVAGLPCQGGDCPLEDKDKK